MKKIYFLSSNIFKIQEIKDILSSPNISVEAVSEKINEIQSDDMHAIVKDKVIKAYQIIARPIVVEQTGLLIEGFGNLPGGLTQIFWDSLKADRFSEFFTNNSTTSVVAKTVLAYCDGHRIQYFDGEISGKIVNPPRGNRDFQWDCIFEPTGYSQTFAEMGIEKNKISMRRIALEKLKKYLEEQE